MPAAKFVPVMVMVATADGTARALGLADVMVGVPLTVKTLPDVMDPKSFAGFVTVTVPRPVGAFPSMLTVAIRLVAVWKVVFWTWIPVFENDATAPLWNPPPVMVRFRLVAPAQPVFGLIDVKVGPAATPKTIADVTVPRSGFVTVTVRVLPVAALFAIVMVTVSVVLLLKSDVVDGDPGAREGHGRGGLEVGAEDVDVAQSSRPAPSRKESPTRPSGRGSGR